MKNIKSYKTTEDFLKDMETRRLFPHLMYDEETDTLLSEHEPSNTIAFTIDTNPELLNVAKTANWISDESTAMTIGECEQILTLVGVNFSTVTSLNELEYFTSLTTIEDSVFSGCTQLTEIKIPAYVSKVQANAFNECTSLTEITLHSGISFIGDNCFNGCTGLTKINIKNSTPFSIGSSVFDNTNNCYIIVPVGCGMAYSIKSGWSEYSDRIYEEGTI